jgi:hypothetical protein
VHLGELEDEKPKHIIHGAVGTGRKSYTLNMFLKGTPPCDYPQAMHERMMTMLLCCLSKDQPGDGPWHLKYDTVPNPHEPSDENQDLNHILTTIFKFLKADTMLVKSKGIIMGHTNSQRVQFQAMKELQARPETVIEGLQGPPIKRHKIGGGDVQLMSTRDDEGRKKLRFTATKRRFPTQEYQHLYYPGFRLPIDHAHAQTK